VEHRINGILTSIRDEDLGSRATSVWNRRFASDMTTRQCLRPVPQFELCPGQTPENGPRCVRTALDDWMSPIGCRVRCPGNAPAIDHRVGVSCNRSWTFPID
jgi:hypothetical protein